MDKFEEHLQEIKFFVNNDFQNAINCFEEKSRTNNNQAGCYSLIRIIFPLIDHTAQLVGGSLYKTSRLLKGYICDYMGKINKRYKISAGLLVYMYRHGLLHQLQPKRIVYENMFVDWILYYREEDYCHLDCKKESDRNIRLYFDIEQFANDFLISLDIYEGKLKIDKNLRDNFSKALKEQEDVNSYKKKDWLKCDDFKILETVISMVNN